MRSKKLSMGIASLLVVGMLAGCTANAPAKSPAASTQPSTAASAAPTAPAAKAPVTISYWFEGANPERTAVIQKIIDGYNNQKNGTTINGEYLDLTKGLEKINASWAAKTMPDLVYLQSSFMSNMFIQGMCAQLDDKFNAWSDKDKFMPSTLKYVRNMDLKERLFAIPCATNITGIWYRKDVFAQKNIPAPTTWDNFFSAVEKLTDPAAKVYGHTLRGGAGSCDQLMNEMVTYTGMGDFWDANGKAQILRSKEAEDVANKFADIFKKKQTPESAMTASFNEMVADFNAQTAMTLIHNLGSYENQRKTFKPEQFAFVPFPAAANGKLTEQVSSVKGISVISTSKNIDAAWDAAKWIASEQSVSMLNESSGEMPSRVDSNNQEWVKKAPHMSNLPAYAAASKQSVMIPSYLPDYKSIMTNYAEKEYQKVLNGSTAARAFLNGWADKLEASYADYQKQKAK